LTGTLKPDSKFAENDHRSHYFRGDRAREVHERVARIASDLGITEAEVPDTALRYVLSEPTVSTVIPAMRSKRNIERNIAVSDGQALDEGRREKLHGHRWVRNFPVCELDLTVTVPGKEPYRAGSGVFMIVLASGWDKPLGSPEELHRYARPAPGQGETVTIKFDPHKRREFVLVEDGYEVTDQVQQTLAALRA
jgi:hypothetical protein